MKTYWVDEISINYEDYVRLHNEGKCNLGLPNFDAAQMAYTRGYLPKGSGIAGTNQFFGFLSWGVLGFSIYLSFTSSWWIFIPGFFIFRFIYNVNKSSNVQNICFEALNNKEFYNKLITNPSTMYQIEEEDAKIFLRDKND